MAATIALTPIKSSADSLPKELGVAALISVTEVSTIGTSVVHTSQHTTKVSQSIADHKVGILIGGTPT